VSSTSATSVHQEASKLSYFATGLLSVQKSRRIRWAGHIAHIWEKRAYTGVWWGNLRERNHLGDPGLDGRIILRRIFRKWDVGIWTRSSWFRIGTGGGHL